MDHSCYIVMTSLVFILCKFQAFVNNVPYCFTLLTTHYAFVTIGNVVCYALYIIIDPECLFLSCTYVCFCLYLQVTPPHPQPSVLCICLGVHISRKLTVHFFLLPCCFSFVFISSLNFSFITQFSFDGANLLHIFQQQLSAVIQPLQLIRPLPPFLLDKYSLSVSSLLGWKAPCTVNIFLFHYYYYYHYIAELSSKAS